MCALVCMFKTLKKRGARNMSVLCESVASVNKMCSVKCIMFSDDMFIDYDNKNWNHVVNLSEYDLKKFSELMTDKSVFWSKRSKRTLKSESEYYLAIKSVALNN